MNIRLGDNLITSFVTEHRINPVLLKNVKYPLVRVASLGFVRGKL